MKKWTIDDSRELYNINGWGTSYFGVNDKGDMYVTPCKDNVQIDLRDVMDELQLRDVTPASRRHRAASRRQLRSTTIRARTSSSTLSR